MDGRIFETHFIRSTQKSRPKNAVTVLCGSVGCVYSKGNPYLFFPVVAVWAFRGLHGLDSGLD